MKTTKKVQTLTNNNSYMMKFTHQLSLFKELILIEWLLIVRNNRTKKYLLQGTLGFIFSFPLLYFVSTNQIAIKNHSIFYVPQLAFTFFFMFGTFAFAFWGNFMELIATKPISLKQVVYYKYFLFQSIIILSLVIYLLISSLMGINIAILLFTYGLWNLGFSSIAILLFATYNIQRCNLSKGPFLNFEAWGFTHNFFIMFIVFLPALICRILIEFKSLFYIYGLISILSIVLLMLHRYFLSLICNNFEKRKYRILEIFRKDQG